MYEYLLISVYFHVKPRHKSIRTHAQVQHVEIGDVAILPKRTHCQFGSRPYSQAKTEHLFEPRRVKVGNNQPEEEFSKLRVRCDENETVMFGAIK